MKTRHLVALPILAGLGATFTFAQALTPAARPAATAVRPAAAEPEKSPRAVSDGVAAAISAGMPKYSPPPKAPEPTPEDQLVDLREVDKPKNQIIRLPAHIVSEPKNPILRERDVSTKSGLVAIAEQRYISDADRALNRWNIFGARSAAGGNSTTARALAMYAEDERLKNMSDLEDAAGLASATDKAAGTYIKREAQKTYMRTGDFGWTGGSSREDRGMNDARTSPR